jgi:hypothetical protein
MAGEAINLANVLTRVQFAQDAYAIFQAVDQSARDELSARQKAHAVFEEARVKQTEHLEGKTVQKINEDQQRGRNFEESLDQARKHLEEHKKAEEEEDYRTPEDGKNLDVII